MAKKSRMLKYLKFKPRIPAMLDNKKFLKFIPFLFFSPNRHFFNLNILLYFFNNNITNKKVKFLWSVFLLKKNLTMPLNSIEMCFVSTRNIYQKATQDVSRLLKTNYSSGETRGTFSNRLKNTNLSKNKLAPSYFFLLNSIESSNFLHELSKQNKNMKLTSIFSFKNSTIPFVAKSQIGLMLQQTESIYNVFLHIYLLAAIRSHNLKW